MLTGPATLSEPACGSSRGAEMDVVERTVRTYDSIASEYVKRTRNPKYLEWEEKYIRKLLYYISNPEPMVLDIGCGDGRHTLIIDRNSGMATGIDLSEGMLKEARRLYPRGDFLAMDMRDLIFDDDTFDGIWSSGSIYHLPKYEVAKAIGEFSRVLKADGVMAVSFKLGSGEGLETRPKSYPDEPRFFAYYTEQEMEELLGHHGFEMLDALPYPEEIFGDSIIQMWFRSMRT
jgi:ubiquinone/menaquinone biosynthesis C-methylase UbiE